VAIGVLEVVNQRPILLSLPRLQDITWLFLSLISYNPFTVPHHDAQCQQGIFLLPQSNIYTPQEYMDDLTENGKGEAHRFF
jgi:hypothetical protein